MTDNTMTKQQQAQKLRAKHLTYAEIAARLGVSETTVYRWLNPKPIPDLIEITNQERARLRMYGETYPDPFGGSLLLSLADRKPASAEERGDEWRDAQREHYPTDKCPDPDCAYAQEVASLHVQVSRLESRLDSARGELERTRERLREAERERDEWREEAWRCYVESGADPDGADARHLNPGEAIRAVRELRADYDAACDELAQLGENA